MNTDIMNVSFNLWRMKNFQNTNKKRDSNRANLEEGADSSASSKVPRLESGDDSSQT